MQHPRRQGAVVLRARPPESHRLRVRHRQRPGGAGCLLQERGLRVQSRGSEQAEGPGGVHEGELRVRVRPARHPEETRQHLPCDDIELHPGGARQPLRGEQACRGGTDVPVLGGDRREGARVPVLEPLREVVPPELQQRRRDVLQQHRQRPADPGQRPGRDPQPGVHRRRGRRADRGPRWTGAHGRALLPRAGAPQRDPRAYSGAAGGVQGLEGDPRCPGRGRRVHEEAPRDLPVVPSRGRVRLPGRDAQRRAGELHGADPHGGQGAGVGEHHQAARHQGQPLAPQQEREVHRGERERRDPVP